MTHPSIESIENALLQGKPLIDDPLRLNIGGCRILVRSNSATLLKRLKRYFAHVLSDKEEAGIEVVAFDRPPPSLNLDFKDWSREPGKRGRKDSCLDLDRARLVHKVRTGMLFVQREGRRIAAGPCVENDNQIINFIIAQYMNWLQHNDWLICHAAGVWRDRQAIGFAGFSGGGKSTLMLHMLEREGYRFLSNDRLFIRDQGQVAEACGVPKLPRINPGTIVHSERLQHLIDAPERERLLALPSQTLWDLEDKYDVMISDLYDSPPVSGSAPLAGFVLLNWRRDSDQATALNRVDLAQRPDLLPTLMKSPGPFYQSAEGSFLPDGTAVQPEPYLRALAHVPIYEACGRVDFEAMTALISETTG